MSIYILTPTFLYLQDLFGRHFGRFAEGRSLVPTRMRILAVGVGNSFVACTSFLMVAGDFHRHGHDACVDIWAVDSRVYRRPVTYMAYAGFAASVEPLERRWQRAPTTCACCNRARSTMSAR